MNRFVYLDNNATTKISDEIRLAMSEYLNLQFGNPSSLYQHGAKVKQKINEARENLAELLNADSKNLIFTSGGSESNCAAFNSAIRQNPDKKRIITTKVEHSSILEYCKMLENLGYDVVYLNVDENCNISTDELKNAVNDNTCLVSIQLANNEVGTVVLNDDVLKCVKALKKQYKFLFHTDCVQGLGKMPIDVKRIDADFMSFSGHKIHCPKGIGLMYVKNPKAFVPLIAGHQEFGLRGGTENVLGIVAMGEASKHIMNNFNTIQAILIKTRDYLEQKLSEISGLNINCKNALRIPNTTSVTFKDLDGNQMMFALEKFGVCVSTGSACNSESSEPSYVLTSMKIKNPQNTIRISIDENTTILQIDYFINALKKVQGGKNDD